MIGREITTDDGATQSQARQRPPRRFVGGEAATKRTTERCIKYFAFDMNQALGGGGTVVTMGNGIEGNYGYNLMGFQIAFFDSLHVAKEICHVNASDNFATFTLIVFSLLPPLTTIARELASHSINPMTNKQAISKSFL